MDGGALYLVFACAAAIAGAGVLALLVRQRRLRAAVARLEQRVESLSDETWELREAEERAKSLLEAQGDVILRRDSDGRLTYANDAFCALAGEPRERLIGRIWTPLVLASGEVATLADGTRCHDQEIETPAGRRWISWHEVAVRTGAQTETQCVGRDVTARMQVERALAESRDQADAANRAKSRFLAMVSHEIRTPLGGMLGMADLLRDTTLTPEQASYVQAVHASGHALLSLIEEILDFSKIEAGKLDLAPAPLALEALVESTVELLAPRAQAKSIEIACYVDPRLPRMMVGDAARLRQVLLNLAGNAVKFTERGGVTVAAEAGSAPDEVVFQIRDSGIGIAADAQARIFEEFEQADSGAARRFGGTGLGLAISKRIVERMGGQLTLVSAAGAGSMFSFAARLPASVGADDAQPDLAGTRVLIAAPTDLEAALVARRLTTWGAAVHIVASAEQACRELARPEWTAVMVDGALGISAAKAIAGACSAAVTRRLVLVTPQNRGELAAFRDAGFFGYLIKPVRTASLAARFGTAHANLSQAIEERQPAAAGPGLSVLVAEDNEINAFLARALLQRLGHRPTLAGDGAQAAAQFEAACIAGTPFDLVLMDVHMPTVDGMAATRLMRAAEARHNCGHTHIVALTADVTASDRDACLAAGMDGFLTKPLDRDRLIETIADVRKAALAA
jgi:PAS domain S-box-containing protein